MKRIAIYGAGCYGSEAIETIEKLGGYEIVALGDSDKSKVGKMLREYKILSIEDFCRSVSEVDFILLSMYRWESALIGLMEYRKINVDKIRIWSEMKIIEIADSFVHSVNSQDGEELFLQERYQTKTHGVYVDVGAYHPTLYSNTAWAYKKGWSGINIEPNPDKFEIFPYVRNRDININCGISERGGEMVYYTFATAESNTFSKELAEKRKKETEFMGQKIVDTEPLSSIFEKYNIKHVDFVNIDVEGLEMQVLKSIDFSKVHIDWFLIEQLGSDLEDVLKSEIAIYLKEHNYHAVSKFDRTVIYEYK